MWVTPRLILNKPFTEKGTGVKHPTEIVDIGKLRWGTANPKQRGLRRPRPGRVQGPHRRGPPPVDDADLLGPVLAPGHGPARGRRGHLAAHRAASPSPHSPTARSCAPPATTGRTGTSSPPMSVASTAGASSPPSSIAPPRRRSSADPALASRRCRPPPPSTASASPTSGRDPARRWCSCTAGPATAPTTTTLVRCWPIDAEVVVPDLRGFGESDKHPEPPGDGLLGGGAGAQRARPDRGARARARR